MNKIEFGVYFEKLCHKYSKEVKSKQNFAKELYSEIKKYTVSDWAIAVNNYRQKNEYFPTSTYKIVNVLKQAETKKTYNKCGLCDGSGLLSVIDVYQKPRLHNSAPIERYLYNIRTRIWLKERREGGEEVAFWDSSYACRCEYGRKQQSFRGSGAFIPENLYKKEMEKWLKRELV